MFFLFNKLKNHLGIKFTLVGEGITPCGCVPKAEIVLFIERLGEIFSNPRKDYQMAYKLNKKIKLRTKNNGTEH